MCIRYCEKCGSEIPKGARFCEKCGSRIEPDIQEGEEDSSHKKWIIGGIIGGVAVVAVVVVALFATGVLGGKDDVVQTSTDGADIQETPSVTGGDTGLSSCTDMKDKMQSETTETYSLVCGH